VINSKTQKARKNEFELTTKDKSEKGNAPLFSQYIPQRRSILKCSTLKINSIKYSYAF
jgi:hypothetical protein